MTYLEAIKGKINYPLSDNTFEILLIDRGLTSTDTYTSCQAFDLAYADAIVTLITSPNITEGSYSVSLTDKKTFINIADGIYKKYSVANPLSSLKPKGTFVQRF